MRPVTAVLLAAATAYALCGCAGSAALRPPYPRPGRRPSLPRGTAIHRIVGRSPAKVLAVRRDGRTLVCVALHPIKR